MSGSVGKKVRLEHFLAGMAAGRPCVLAFDFDGTLAGIVEKPSMARMDAELRRLLGRLAVLPGVRLAVLSGRSLPSLKKKIAIPRAVLFSNHGLDCSHKSLAPAKHRRERWKALARRARKAVLPLLKNRPGAWVEDKGLDLTLHVRALAPALREPLLREVARTLKALPVRLKRGKLALEIRPVHGEHKGLGLMRLQRHWHRDALCFFTGDDRTDEDAFKSMRALGPDALGLKIGPGPTAAPFRASRAGLAPFLRKVLKARLSGGR